MSSPTRSNAASAPRNPRVLSNYSKSSAFCECAKTNEDWTQIENLVERRRIQNRIAQRRYRHKLKVNGASEPRKGSKSAGTPKKAIHARSKSVVEQESQTTPTVTESTQNRSASVAMPLLPPEPLYTTSELEAYHHLSGLAAEPDSFHASYEASDSELGYKVDPAVTDINIGYWYEVNDPTDWNIEPPSVMTSPAFLSRYQFDSTAFSPGQMTEPSPLMTLYPAFSPNSTLESPPTMVPLGDSPYTDALSTPSHTPCLRNDGYHITEGSALFGSGLEPKIFADWSF